MTVRFLDESIGLIQSWQWNFNSESSSIARNPEFTFKTPGDKTITLIAQEPRRYSSREISRQNPTECLHLWHPLRRHLCSGTFIDVAYFVSELLGIQRDSAMIGGGRPEVIALFTVIDDVHSKDQNYKVPGVNC